MSPYPRVVWGGMVRHEVEHQLDAAPGLHFARQTLEPDTAIDLKATGSVGRQPWSFPAFTVSIFFRAIGIDHDNIELATALLNVRVGTAKGDQFTEVSKRRNHCLRSARLLQTQALPR